MRYVVLFFMGSVLMILPSRSQTLRMALNPYPPFESINEGKPEGLNVEIVKKLGELLAMKILYIRCSWKRCLQGMQDGTFNIMGDLVKTKQSERSLTYMPTPYYRTPEYAYERGSSVPSTHKCLRESGGYNDLRRKTVAFLRGSSISDRFDKDTSIIKASVSSFPSGLKMLQAHRVSFLVGPSAGIDRSIDLHSIQNVCKSFLLRTKQKGEMYFAVSKKFRGRWDVLRAYTYLEKKGIIKAIKLRYTSAYSVQEKTQHKHMDHK